jgi:hypothetical protein
MPDGGYRITFEIALVHSRLKCSFQGPANCEVDRSRCPAFGELHFSVTQEIVGRDDFEGDVRPRAKEGEERGYNLGVFLEGALGYCALLGLEPSGEPVGNRDILDLFAGQPGIGLLEDNA